MKIKLPEELLCERFAMRKLSEKDIEPWMSFILSQEALKYISFIKSTEQACIDWIMRQIERYQNNTGGLYGIYQHNGTLIGQCGLLVQEIESKAELEISYHILPQYWKKGYAYEAASAWKNYAFQNRLNNSLISMIHVENIASQAVARKIGMKQENKTEYKGLAISIFRISYFDWLQSISDNKIAKN